MEAQKVEDHRPGNATASQKPAQKGGKAKKTNKIAPMNVEERKKLLASLLSAEGPKENCVTHDTFAQSDQDQLLSLAQIVAHPDTSNEPDLEEPDEGDSTSSGFRYNSASAPSFESACAILGIDPQTSTYNLEGQKTISLKPWQITGCAWMIGQEDGPIQGGMLNDACGIGKTLTVLTTIYHQASRSTSRPMKPTLVLCPPTVIEVWMDEIQRCFGDLIRVFIFLGRVPFVTRKWGRYIVSDHDELERGFSKLDPDDPRTGRTIVLTSYGVWLGRMCTVVRPADDGKENSERKRKQTADAREAADFAQSASKAKRRNKQYASLMTRTFARVVCDHAQKVKNPTSGYHQAAALLEASHYWLVTASPMWNRPSDVAGFLSMLFRPSFHQNTSLKETNDDQTDEDSEAPNNTIFRPIGVWDYRAFENVRFTHDMQLPTYLLSPKSVARLALKINGWDDFGRFVLPVVMGMISLSRNIGELIDMGPGRQAVPVGKEIPPMKVLTVNLRFPTEEQAKHNKIYAQYVEELGFGSNDSPSSESSINEVPKRLGFPNFRVERMLRLAAFSPQLHDFAEAVGQDGYASELPAQVSELGNSFSQYWRVLFPNGASSMPSTAYEIAYYMAQTSPKLRYLLQIFSDEGLLIKDGSRESPRFLVLCKNPLVLWLLGIFVFALGIQDKVIRLGEDMQSKFSVPPDLTTGATRLLLTTFERGSLGLNIHEGCSRVIMLETPGTLSMIRQVMGRVHRLGQQSEQKAWILFQDHTIERWIEYCLAYKAIPGLISAIGPKKQQNDGSDASTQMLGDDGNGQAMVAAQLVRMLGQSESRLKYNNPHDLGDPRFDGPFF